MGQHELQLGKEVAGDVEALSGLDAAAFEQVATIAAEQLRTGGPGGKAIKSAAAALGLGAAELATALEALSFVIAEAAHQNIPESGLREQLQEQLPLPAEAIEVLVQVSLAAAPQARSVAEDLGHPLPAFRSLDWRLDVQVGPALRLLPLPALVGTKGGALTRTLCRQQACLLYMHHAPSPLGSRLMPLFRRLQMGSRCLRGQTTPKMTIKLETAKAGDATTHYLEAELADVEHMCQEIKNALQEGRSNHSRKVARMVT